MVKGVGSNALCSNVLVLTDRPPPIILQGPVNQTLAVDGTALLKCKATGDPLPVISWLKEGFTFLGRDPRTSIQDQGTLQIKALRVSNGSTAGSAWPELSGASGSSAAFLLSSKLTSLFYCAGLTKSLSILCVGKGRGEKSKTSFRYFCGNSLETEMYVPIEHRS